MPDMDAQDRNVIDEVRRARVAIAQEHGGLSGLGDYLRQVELEFSSRTGRYASVPTTRPTKLQQMIDSSDSTDQQPIKPRD